MVDKLENTEECKEDSRVFCDAPWEVTTAGRGSSCRAGGRVAALSRLTACPALHLTSRVSPLSLKALGKQDCVLFHHLFSIIYLKACFRWWTSWLFSEVIIINEVGNDHFHAEIKAPVSDYFFKADDSAWLRRVEVLDIW